MIELLQNDFVESVERIIIATGVPPECVGLEITESVLMESLKANSKKLARIRHLGVAI